YPFGFASHVYNEVITITNSANLKSRGRAVGQMGTQRWVNAMLVTRQLTLDLLKVFLVGVRRDFGPFRTVGPSCYFVGTISFTHPFIVRRFRCFAATSARKTCSYPFLFGERPWYVFGFLK